MHQTTTIAQIVDLIDPGANVLLNVTYEQAADIVAAGDPEQIRRIDGQFAIVQKRGHIVRMARSLGRPMRYFLAKQAAGPCLVVAERIDELERFLAREGLGDQFHPSYSRMVPAHYLTEIALVGCPDPNPVCTRFFTPQHNRLPADVDAIGRAYIGALADECSQWLDRIDPRAPIGVLFSGGIDSGAVFLVLYHVLLSRGQSPARLKAFTLSIDGQGSDARQARAFLEALDLEMFLEVIDAPASAVDFREAIRVIEDYKPLDVQSATMAVALCRGIRQRYPEWRHLVDGDGGDENLKDYPIEENPELTIRSVLNNLMLYQEGWGVEAIKHSLVYTGGQSRGHVRTYAPARAFGFCGFSPFALPNVVEIAEGIPFVELTDWRHEKLYALKGDVVTRGVVEAQEFGTLFPESEDEYRRHFASLYQ